FSAVEQSQGTAFTRPQLGFQNNSTLTAGVTGQFSWEVPALTRFANRFPSSNRTTASHLSFQGELATSKPQFAAGGSGEAFVDTFEGTAGLTIALGDGAWRKGSLPAYGRT